MATKCSFIPFSAEDKISSDFPLVRRDCSGWTTVGNRADVFETALEGPQIFDHREDRNLALYEEILKEARSRFEPGKRIPRVEE